MNKSWYKERLFAYECRAIEIINENLPKRDTLKKLRRELNNLDIKLDSIEYQALWNFSLSLYHNLRTKRQKPPLNLTFRAMQHKKNQVADDIEFRIKHETAMNLIRSDNVFYQCDSHPNCADGHRAYEGGIFINEDAASEKEKEFARKHNIPTLQEVVFGEPYLTTRRNCRHVLRPVPTDMVLNNAVPNPPTDLDDVSTSSAYVYRAYYDRKKFLQAAGVSKKDDTYKRTVSLIKKHKL